ncbi:MAG: hypothetical protein CK425_10220 [Parachlamydia sp.]|nr:MAG: hypothetical protein CK425_10220 [Parachlamydia sp.]
MSYEKNYSRYSQKQLHEPLFASVVPFRSTIGKQRLKLRSLAYAALFAPCVAFHKLSKSNLQHLSLKKLNSSLCLRDFSHSVVHLVQK